MSEGLQRSAPSLRTRPLGLRDRAAALAHLAIHADENLALIDSVLRQGETAQPREIVPQVYGVFAGDVLEGVVSLRPSIVLSAGMGEEAIETIMPLVRRIPSGLVKCERSLADPVWRALRAGGRRELIDRVEIAYRLTPEQMRPASESLPGVARPARSEDLEELVYAARASLWEEERPDPAEGDPVGFRHWVESRLGRARVVCDEGRMVFVAYADVRRSEGWLVQGVYTWPEVRRRGYARRGMDSVIREAFASGASHVQLAVIEGNERASTLYSELGFEAFEELRTVLFH